MYLLHTDLMARISLNPFKWLWKPIFVYDRPSVIMPKRHTFMLGWLFIQLFLDVDNGEMNLSKMNFTFNPAEDIIDEDGQVGRTLFGDGSSDSSLV